MTAEEKRELMNIMFGWATVASLMNRLDGADVSRSLQACSERIMDYIVKYEDKP